MGVQTVVDEFSFDLEFAHWAFTFALGVPAGLAIVGLWLVYRSWAQGPRWPGLVVAVTGVALFLLVAAMPVDQLPINYLPLKLKLYLSDVAVVAVLNLALVLGIVAGAAPAIAVHALARRRNIRPAFEAAAQIGVVAVVGLLAVAWADEDSSPPRHPHGTVTDETVEAAPVVQGVAMVTGLDIGPQGELAFVELNGRRLRIEGNGVSRSVELGIGEDAEAFHVALHPDWPTQPYAYVTVDRAHEEETNELSLLRVRTDGQNDVRTLVHGIPISQPEDGNHFGSAVAFCGRTLYLSTGDSDTVTTNPQNDLRARAQSPGSPAGKVLRYELEGIELRPNGAAGGDPPIYAMGLRNPFAMTCGTDAGSPIVADNGNLSNDQVRVATSGSNHEWPFTITRHQFSEPLYDTGDVTIAPTGIALRDGADGKELLVAGYKSGGVYLLHLESDGTVTRPPVLLHEFRFGVVSLALDGAGCIYVSDPEAIYRLQEPGCE